MKKISIILITGIVILFSNHTAKACEIYIQIAASTSNSQVIDTICIHEGETIPLYAIYSIAFYDYFPESYRNLTWIRDGLAFNTSSYTEAIYSGGQYITTIFVSTPGIYQIQFLTTVFLGKVVVINCDSVSAPSNSAPSETFENEMTVYPNPSSEGYFYIDSKNADGITSIEIMNTAGEVVQETAPNSTGIITIQTEGYQKGLYFVRINYIDESITKKVILN